MIIGPRDIFAAEAERVVRDVEGVLSVKRAREKYALEITTSTGTGLFFLRNAFAETREMSPEQRAARIADMARASREADDAPNDWESAQKMLVPILRRSTHDIALWSEEPKATFIRGPFLPFIDELVAMDLGPSLALLNRDNAAHWNVTEEEIIAASTARRHWLENPAVERYDKTNGNLWIVATHDDYEVSTLLLPGWLASFEGRVDGRPIAIMPERSTLVIGGDARPAMVKRLLDKADREYDASNRRISPALYSVDAHGAVVPYVREKNDELAKRARLAHAKLAKTEYDTQARVLEPIHADALFGRYDIMENRKDGSVRSFSIWPKGYRTYLPRTDSVVLGTADDTDGAVAKEIVVVPFEEIASSLTRVEGLWPERFETGAWPEGR